MAKLEAVVLLAPTLNGLARRSHRLLRLGQRGAGRGQLTLGQGGLRFQLAQRRLLGAPGLLQPGTLVGQAADLGLERGEFARKARRCFAGLGPRALGPFHPLRRGTMPGRHMGLAHLRLYPRIAGSLLG